MAHENNRSRAGDAGEDAETRALWHLCRQLIEASPLPMAAVDGPQHRVRSVNPAFCRLIGAAQDGVIGRPFPEVVPEWAGSWALLDRVSRTGKAETLVDQACVCSCAVWPLRRPGGQPTGLMILVPASPDTEQFRQQLTAMNEALVVSSVQLQERTEAAEALTSQVTAQKVLLETILEQAAEEIVVRNAQGQLLLANAEVRRWLRPIPDGPAALEGTPLERVPYLWGDMLDAEGRPLPVDAYPMARALRGEPVSPMEFHRVAPDGQMRVLLNNAAPIRDLRGAIVGAVAISTDITLQKQKEVELRRARDELEQRVRERTAALERTSHQLRVLASELTLSEQRERLRLAEQIHDGLQQLLVAAKLGVILLERREDPTVRQSCQEIRRLLDEAIADSRSLTAELSPPVLRTGGLLAGLEWLTSWSQEKHHFTVHVTAPAPPLPTLPEDLTALLFQSVRELLFNAVKYAQVPEAAVTLAWDAPALTLTVADAGAGFDPRGLRGADDGGGGFGLTRIRYCLELLGGWMTIDSAPGKGTRVTLAILLPTADRPAAMPARPQMMAPSQTALAPEPGSPPKIRILIVDDHRVVRRALGQMLRAEADLEVVGEAGTGTAAVTLAGRLSPDVVLMDINMPEMDGIEATQAIHAAFPAMRVIGLSMFDRGDQQAAMQDAGAVAYVSKSAPAEGLLAAIRDGR